jgi:hypothetical protein
MSGPGGLGEQIDAAGEFVQNIKLMMRAWAWLSSVHVVMYTPVEAVNFPHGPGARFIHRNHQNTCSSIDSS